MSTRSSPLPAYLGCLTKIDMVQERKDLSTCRTVSEKDGGNGGEEATADRKYTTITRYLIYERNKLIINTICNKSSVRSIRTPISSICGVLPPSLLSLTLLETIKFSGSPSAKIEEG